ncbi:hypothetical protein KEJ26_00365 [Candidatus Bathyarchaeota archaeon]|nr:hypothetical protein [Candidatus Bathyarchaeota archaeon]
MYVGRLLIVGAPKSGGILAGYRLASRSFPNRKFVIGKDFVRVEPIKGYESNAAKTPFTIYTCLRVCDGNSLLVANGTHLAKIYTALHSGITPVHAISKVLAELGPEEDAYKTPRIVGYAAPDELAIGIVMEKGITVKSFPVEVGKAYYVATYLKIDPIKNVVQNFEAKSALTAAQALYNGSLFKRFSYGICAVAALAKYGRIEIKSFPYR